MNKKIYIWVALLVLSCCMIFTACSGSITEEKDHEHNYVERTFKANCTDDGRTEKICTVCGDIVPISIVQALGHEMGQWTVTQVGTCIKPTTKERVCNREGCTKTESETVAAVGHAGGEWQVTQYESCTLSRIEKKFCKVCNEVVESKSDVGAYGHTPGEWQITQYESCTTYRTEEKFCKTCNAVVESKETVEPLGHAPSEEWQVKQDATCSQNKIEEKICTRCGISVETKVGERQSHDYMAIPVSATCITGEHVLHTCRHCGDSYRDQQNDNKAPHTDGGWVIEKAPTCIASGSRAKICSVCGVNFEYDSNVAPNPNNHSFIVETSAPDENGIITTSRKCQLCNTTFNSETETNYLPSQIYEMIVSSTVRIESLSKKGELQSVGSGFFVTGDGMVVTNYHVIAGAYSLKVKNYDGVEFLIEEIMGYDAFNDIAVIKVNAKDNAYLTVSTTEAKTGDIIYALGSPLGIDDIFTDGVVSNPLKRVNGVDFIVFSAPISPGNSGGPLVNGRGEVIGINSRTAVDGQNINFAILASQIDALDKSKSLTVEELYNETLSISGYNVLAYYIKLNYESKMGDKYYITRVIAEEGTAYGRNCQFIYDEKAGTVTVSVNWTTGRRNIYSIEFLFEKISDKYTVRFFDHVWSQYTIEATLDPTVQATITSGNLDASVLNKAFKFDYVNYHPTNGDPLKEEDAKRLVGIAYGHMLESFESFLAETETGLTLDIFNYKSLIKNS